MDSVSYHVQVLNKLFFILEMWFVLLAAIGSIAKTIKFCEARVRKQVCK